MKNKNILSTTSGVLVVFYCAYLLISWYMYRILFFNGEEIDELIVKPFMWILPVGIILYIEARGPESLGITPVNWMKSLLYGVGLGLIFFSEAVFLNYLKYGNIELNSNIGSLPIVGTFAISFVTSFIEEVTFRGYVLSRFLEFFNELKAVLLMTLVWVLIHVPVALFVWRLDPGALLIYLFLVGIYGVGAGVLFSRTRNILSVVILHILWSWPIILFK